MLNFIDFEITENNEKKYISWVKLCRFAREKPYQPSTPELASIKLQLAKSMGLDPDSVIVRLNRQPIL